LNKAAISAQFSTQIRAEIVPFKDKKARTDYLVASFEKVILAWKNPTTQLIHTQTGANTNEVNNAENSFTQSSPGMMVQFAIAGLIGAAEVLVLERKSGSLRRLLTTPIKRFEVLLGHFLAMIIMIFSQFSILIIFAQLFLDVPYLNAPIATFLVAFSTAVFSASVGLLIGAVAKNSEQVVVFSLIPMFVLSGLGGAWVPLEFTGEAFQKVANLTPLAWSMKGFRNIIERGQGLESVLFPITVLLSFAVVIFIIAVWRFQFEEV
jgi:ABC-2 type transport system permease protein